MKTLLKILVCFLAGAGAGIGTGFAGMSAAGVIAPFLITFVKIPAYQAIGVGLASDVLASAVSAYTYKKNKNIDIRNGLVMMVCVVIMTIVGSFTASHLSGFFMGNFSYFIIIGMGIRFIVKPILKTREDMANQDKRKKILESIAGGCITGFFCGLVGAGGGMMMLFVLTTFLGYELKTAVGTSVLIMTVTAFTGAVSHFRIGGMPDIPSLLLCIAFTLLWARIASVIANKASPKLLNRVLGIMLIIIGVVTLIFQYA